MKRLLPLLLVVAVAAVAWQFRERLNLDRFVTDAAIQTLGQALGRETDSKEMLQTLTPAAGSGGGVSGASAGISAQAAEAGDGGAGGQPPTATPKPPAAMNYSVVRGDTLAAIARRFGTSATVLAEMNDIPNPGILLVGQVLKIPPRPTPPTPPPHTEIYRVKAGDTLAAIARKLGMNLSELVILNPHIADPNQLSAGDHLIIPAKTTPTATPTPTPDADAGPTASPSPTTAAATAGEGTPVNAQTADEAGAAPTSVFAIGTPTPGPTPIPPPIPGQCPPAERQARIWKISFCLPPGWTTAEQYDPFPGVIIYKDEETGDRSLFAIFRPDGAGGSPLTQIMRAAKKNVPGQLNRYVNVAVLGDWVTVEKGKEEAVAGYTFQRAENEGAYRKTDTEANIRLIVFKDGKHRWAVLVAAPKTQWDAYDAQVFGELTASIRVLD